MQPAQVSSPRPWKRPRLASDLPAVISPSKTVKDPSAVKSVPAPIPSGQNGGVKPFAFDASPTVAAGKDSDGDLSAPQIPSLSYPVFNYVPPKEKKSLEEEAARIVKLFDHQVLPDSPIAPNSQSLVPFTAALSDDSDFGEGYEYETDEEEEFQESIITLSQTELLSAMAMRLNQGRPADLVSLRVEVSQAVAKELKMYLWMNGPHRFMSKYVYSGLREHALGEILAALSFPLPEKLVKRSKSEELIELVRLAVQYTIMPRTRLPTSLTVDNLTDIIHKANNIIVLTGAGISTSLGIPDFRSKSGLYNKLAYLGLSDPQEVFDLSIFRSDPSIFYSIAKEILPVSTKFSPTHAFIKLLQDKGKLLRNYTQNIDNLEQHAGIKREKLVQCHGSFAFATCQTCGYKAEGTTLFDDIRMKRIARCPVCAKSKEKKVPSTKRKSDSDDDDDDDIENIDPVWGVMKPDITFFGEALPQTFEHTLIGGDADVCDLLICIGTSLKVSPVSETVRIIPPNIPQIYISKELAPHCEFDLTFKGPCDDVVEYLCDKLHWKLDHPMMKNRPYSGSITYDEEMATYEFSD